jgi:carbon-monoxide dehydrogenase medium subunit
MVTLGATIIARGPGGERRIAANAFFAGIYETVLSPQELLVAVELPAAPTHSTHFFHEFARRSGDYAIVGLAAQAIVRGEQFADIRLGFFAIGDRPLLAKSASRLIDVAITPAILSEASSLLGEELDPPEDQQATPAMRRHLAKVLLARGVSSLLSRPDLRVGAPA